MTFQTVITIRTKKHLSLNTKYVSRTFNPDPDPGRINDKNTRCVFITSFRPSGQQIWAFPSDPEGVFPFFAGDPLQWLLEDPPVHAGHVPVRLLLPNRGAGGRGAISASQCNHWDQAAQQHVYVQSQLGFKTDFPRFQVSSSFTSCTERSCVYALWFPNRSKHPWKKIQQAKLDLELGALKAFQAAGQSKLCLECQEIRACPI